ncbi:MAG: phage antirepressor N-terminal domain-containing protein [Pseudomonadota bacterium]
MGKIITVNFRGDELYGFENDDGVFVALKPMVEAMGMPWESQRQRVRKDPILNEGARLIQVPFGRGGAQEQLCLRESLVQGWLFTIDSTRIKDEQVRQRVQMYQRECYAVLHEHFIGKAQRPEMEIDAEPDDKPTLTERRQLVTEARQTFGTAAARQLWFRNGLPIVPAMLKPEGQGELFEIPRLIGSDAT